MYEPGDTYPDALPDALGESEVFLDFQERLSRVAAVDRPVLLIGERGTGKELAARRVHFLSRRWQEPLVELNCAALPASLIESELFGHEAGAFTGAQRQRRGRFELANGGTLFLDELGNIPLSVQEKILRVVEYGRFERVGGTEQVSVDVRIVGATNADLPRLAEEGRFMRDLLDRLSFEVLYLPPLRARQEDILLLAQHFSSRMAFELGRKTIPRFSAAVEKALNAHPWRGNVRELKNVVERAVYQARGELIDRVVFDPFHSPFAPLPVGEGSVLAGGEAAPVRAAEEAGPAVDLARPFTEQVAALERRLIQAALEEARFNQRKAAELLGLTYHQFRGLYRKYEGSQAGPGGDISP
ncbi:MAG: phage shock protein operon transcriptional activator [Candidatus Hydrogenedentes bacterium]|nr:phage shock protein operon transcriptional activator [Candidatus Hydrogenedentota bacterium]